MIGAKARNHRRQHVGRHTRKRTDADFAAHESTHLIHPSLQASEFLAERLDSRHDLPPVGRKHYALATAVEHLKAPIGLKIGHHTAHARLRIAQALGSTRKASGAHRLQQHLHLLNIRFHDTPPPLHEFLSC